MLRPREESELEQVEDALVDGDVPYQRGTAQAALRHRDFRIVYFGVFASNIGTWMQNVGARRVRVRAHAQRRLRQPGVLRPARPAAVPVAVGRRARRHRRPAPLPRLAPRSRRACCRSCSAAVAFGGNPSTTRHRRDRVRDRHRQRAGRARAQRDPADARAPRRPARRGRAHVGADEPVTRHRARDRRRARTRGSARAGCSRSTRSRTCSR